MNANEKQSKKSGDRVPHRSRNIGIAAASTALMITGLGACTASGALSSLGGDRVLVAAFPGSYAHLHDGTGTCTGGYRNAYGNSTGTSASSGPATVC